MKSKEKGLALLLVLSLYLTVFVRPFSVYANTSLTAPFLGVNVTVIDAERNYTRLNTQNLTFEQNGTVSYICQNYDSNTGGCNKYNEVQNGGTTEYIVESNITLTSSIYYVYEYEVILDNYYVGSVNLNGTEYFINGTSFIFTSSSVVSTFTFSNVDLSLLNDNKTMWIYPIEFFTSINTVFQNGFNQIGIDEYNNYLFPIFEADVNKDIINNNISANGYVWYVLFAYPSVNSLTGFNNQFAYNSDFVASDFYRIYNSPYGSLFKVKLSSSVGGYTHLQSKTNQKFSLLLNMIGNGPYNLSNDIAIIFDFENSYIANINKIVNGTNSSNTSSNSLDDSNSDFNDTVSDYQNLENDFNDNFDDAMQNINIAPISDMGSKFLSSASWVRTQFDNIVNNTPYGSVLGFSLILGFSLLIIGKVYK